MSTAPVSSPSRDEVGEASLRSERHFEAKARARPDD
jgi:hypothetical protein